jgi:hypothetical protein
LTNPLESLGLGAVLAYQPGLLDLLPMYCIFVLLLYGVIPALDAGRRLHVLAYSGGVWLLMQFFPTYNPTPLGDINVGSFNVFAWQFLFVLGACLGHGYKVEGRALRRPPLVLLMGMIGVLVYGFGLRQYHWAPIWWDHTFGVFLNKPSLGLFRLLNFGCFVYLLAYPIHAFPRLFVWRPLAFLGGHSLQVVAAQSIGVMTLLEFSSPFATQTRAVISTFAAVGFLFLVAWGDDWLKSRRSSVAPQGD